MTTLDAGSILLFIMCWLFSSYAPINNEFNITSKLRYFYAIPFVILLCQLTASQMSDPRDMGMVEPIFHCLRDALSFAISPCSGLTAMAIESAAWAHQADRSYYFSTPFIGDLLFIETLIQLRKPRRDIKRTKAEMRTKIKMGNLIHFFASFILMALTLTALATYASSPSLRHENRWNPKATMESLASFRDSENGGSSGLASKEKSPLPRLFNDPPKFGFDLESDRFYDSISKNRIEIIPAGKSIPGGDIVLFNVDMRACLGFTNQFIRIGLRENQHGKKWFTSIESPSGSLIFGGDEAKMLIQAQMVCELIETSPSDFFKMRNITMTGLHD